MAEAFKAQGNEALKNKQFDEAIKHYTSAIELAPDNHVYFSNRSAASLSKGDAANALNDAEQCMTLKPDWPKAHSRKVAALHSLGRLDEALAACRHGLSLCSADDASLAAALKSVTAAISARESAASAAATSAAGKSKGGVEAAAAAASEKDKEPEPVVAEWKQQSEKMKDEGNAAFKAGNHAGAIQCYRWVERRMGSTDKSFSQGSYCQPTPFLTPF
jgi:tetratricopeptide (TPR) repeat protein